MRMANMGGFDDTGMGPGQGMKPPKAPGAPGGNMAQLDSPPQLNTQMPFKNPLNFAQRKQNAAFLYGPKPAPQAGVLGGPMGQGDPPQFGGGQPLGGVAPPFQAGGMSGGMGQRPRTRPMDQGGFDDRMRPPQPGGFGPPPPIAGQPPQMQMPQDMMGRIQRLFSTNPQLFMQLLGPHLG